MSANIDRRTFLAGTTAGSLVLLSLGGCNKPDENKGAIKTSAGSDSGQAKPHYAMVFDQNKCIGCGLCKEACNETNKLPKGVSRLVLERQTTQCQDAPCVRVCPTGAAHRDPKTGIVTMDPDRCVGCKYCIAACPYNVRYINSETKVADNCDFCLKTKLANGEEPACVQACRHGALYFGDVNDPQSIISRLLRVKDTVRIRPHLGTEPSLRYVTVQKEGV